MRKDFVEMLRCPECGGGRYEVARAVEEGAEVVEGAARCAGCGIESLVKKGILCFEIKDEAVLREKAQWEEFAGTEGWLKGDELYLESLPSAGANLLMKKDTLNWGTHEYNFFRVLKALGADGKRLLDLGAGRCWSSKWQALSGARVTAFDAMEHETLGLGAGDVFMRNHDIYFDRVSGDFNKLPFKDGLFDVVFVSGALHHSTDLEKTVSEVARVVRSGGLFAVVNEPVSNFRAAEPAVVHGGAQEGINEFSYRVTRLTGLFARHGFSMRTIFEPVSVYERDSPYYQGVFSAAINATAAGRLLALKLRGGVLNCILEKKA